MITLLAASRIDGGFFRAGAAHGALLALARAVAWICPKAPNSTLVNERFMALHMMMERIRPRGAIERAGDDQQLVVQREAHGAGRKAGVGVQQRDHRGHVGAADGDDQQHAEHQRQAGEDREDPGVGGDQR